MSDPAPEIRVGDRERRDVDALLQESLADGVLTLTEYDERAGQCWAARTRTELDRVVCDLPGGRRQPVVAAGDASAARRVVAVMSDSELAAPVLPGQQVQAVAVMGTAKVDLRRDDLPAETRVRAVAVMGDVKVYVPPGSTVHLTGGTVMGNHKTKLGPPATGGPLVHVDATAVLGSVVVDDRPRKGGLLPADTGWTPVPRWPSTRTADSADVASRRPGAELLRRASAAVLPLAAAAGLLFAGSQILTADDGVTVFGSRTVPVTDEETIEVGLLFGSVEVVVPDEARVRTGGVMVFGSVDCGTACEGTGDRELLVRSTGGFGSVEIVRKSERDLEDADD